MYDKYHQPGTNLKSIRTHKKKLSDLQRIQVVIPPPFPGGLHIHPEQHLHNQTPNNLIPPYRINWNKIPILCDPIQSNMYQSLNKQRNERRGIKKR